MKNRKFISKVNNAQGKLFESMIEAGCTFYRENCIAKIDKIPEPFRVMKKKENGKFEGRFMAKAEPDFQGTLKGGYSIVFEAKYTSADKFKISVLSEQQVKSLNMHLFFEANTFVIVGIRERQFFVPWEFLKREIENGKKSFKAEDLKWFEVFYRPSTGLDFLKNCIDI